MNVIEEEAKIFAEHFPQKIAGLRVAKEILEQKLNNFTTTQGKISFLNFLDRKLYTLANQHKEKCKNPTCTLDRDYELALFAVEQEIKCMYKSHRAISSKNYFFLSKEIAALNEKLDTVKNNLNHTEREKEIINVLSDLKNHYDLGKNQWLIFLNSNLLELRIKNLLNRESSENIYRQIIEGIEK